MNDSHLLYTGNVSKELSYHPIHLTPDNEGVFPPSALVPFCSYQGTLLGQVRPELGNIKVCDLFKPTILDGQLCYSLDSEKLGEYPVEHGKEKGLSLLLDPSPFQLDRADKNNADIHKGDQSFKLTVHTLAPFTTFGPGSFGMSALKKMTGTKSFEKLPDQDKKCSVHNREECETRKYLEKVQSKCNCTPWALQQSQYQDKVG